MGFKAALVAVLVIAVPAPEERERKDETQQVLAKLQGEWHLARLNLGNDLGPDIDNMLGQLRFVFQGRKLTVHQPGNRTDEADFTIDVSKKPYAIDVRPTTGPEKGQLSKAIFEITGDTLQLTVARPGKDRPADFTPAAKSEIVTVIFRRAAKK
jgi:uncharacterized protein (TIGR03067 family)